MSRLGKKRTVNAIYKKEKIKNTVTGKYEEPDKYFIKEFEKWQRCLF